MNAVCPGTVETPSWHVSLQDHDDENIGTKINIKDNDFDRAG